MTKGGNRKGIPLTRDFFAVVFSFTGFGFLSARFLVFRVSLGVLPEKDIPLNEGEVGGERNFNRAGTFLRLSLGFSGFGFLWAKQSRNPPLWQRQRKEHSSCGNCGKTRSGVVRVIEVLEIVGVVDGSGNYK